jgi:hypothetical protein
MSPMDSEDTRARANTRRETRMIRTRTIRRRVIAGALSLFVATWLLITLVLVSGHDPALAARQKSSAAGASTATPTVTSTGTPSAGSTSAGTSSGSASGGTSSAGATSAVTTRQS